VAAVTDDAVFLQEGHLDAGGFPGDADPGRNFAVGEAGLDNNFIVQGPAERLGQKMQEGSRPGVSGTEGLHLQAGVEGLEGGGQTGVEME